MDCGSCLCVYESLTVLLLLGVLVSSPQVFNEKTPLDDDAKPSESMQGGPHDKLNWMKVSSCCYEAIWSLRKGWDSMYLDSMGHLSSTVTVSTQHAGTTCSGLVRGCY